MNTIKYINPTQKKFAIVRVRQPNYLNLFSVPTVAAADHAMYARGYRRLRTRNERIAFRIARKLGGTLPSLAPALITVAP